MEGEVPIQAQTGREGGWRYVNVTVVLYPFALMTRFSERLACLGSGVLSGKVENSPHVRLLGMWRLWRMWRSLWRLWADWEWLLQYWFCTGVRSSTPDSFLPNFHEYMTKGLGSWQGRLPNENAGKKVKGLPPFLSVAATPWLPTGDLPPTEYHL